MHYFIFKAITVFSVFVLCNQSFAVSDNPKERSINQVFQFEDVLIGLENLFQENNYSEQLYNIASDDEIYRLLVVHNPKSETIQRGNMQIGMRYIFGYDKNFPKNWRDKINQFTREKGLSGIFSSAGSTFNGKTLFDLFGY